MRTSPLRHLTIIVVVFGVIGFLFWKVTSSTSAPAVDSGYGHSDEH